MKVLIIGLGPIAKKHIKALRKVFPDVIIYALRSQQNNSEVEGVINIYDLPAINNLAIDFVIISNPTANHQQTIKQLIPYNLPLFIEKPLFDNVDATTILKDVKAKHIITYVACNLRFLGCLGFIKQFVQDKRINEVNSYCGSYLPDWRPMQDFREVYSANKEMGGGVHLDLIHEIDYIYWLFGIPNKAFSTKTNKSSLSISAIDYANYLLEYPRFCASIVLNYYRRDAKRTLEILTDEGTIYVDLLKNNVLFNGKLVYSSEKTIMDTYEDQLSFFIDQILVQKQKFNTIDEAFKILKLCIAND